ncbi:histidine phosphatase family protein [Chryseolinea sp. H1M3-3]|uniref:SixA phosphatase family protein n=1 Tax=Chryseolinea sp. H1M3-3 TaxID=3034144 RepID=UPI0023ED44D4|nr:histidine phosphatase family protein [Chryseolinea sp. H1M3-3]
MKTLYVVRHAKSSWEDPNQPDFERGLNKRGKRDVPRMAKRLKEKNFHPDLILTSPAKRAFSTAKKMAEILLFPKEKIKTDRILYHADEETILSVVQTINDKHDTILVLGHNPGLTEFVNALAESDVFIDNVPTCGVVAFSMPVDSWKEVNWKSGKLLFYDYPKAAE